MDNMGGNSIFFGLGCHVDLTSHHSTPVQVGAPSCQLGRECVGSNPLIALENIVFYLFYPLSRAQVSLVTYLTKSLVTDTL